MRAIFAKKRANILREERNSKTCQKAKFGARLFVCSALFNNCCEFVVVLIWRLFERKALREAS